MTSDRRSVLKAGAGIVAASLLPSAAGAQGDKSVGVGPYTAKAYGAESATSPLKQVEVERRALGPSDVLLDIMYCGVCHSDIHTVRGEWGPAHYPCVPGHEIIGRVRAVGSAVTKFKVGDIGGVGCMVNSCRTCEHCQEDLEQYCQKGATFTYDTPDTTAKAGFTQGGYSDKIVVTEHFVIRIPPGVNLAATAPLLCAGITTFSPMEHWSLSAGEQVGIIGLGGLGHVAVKLAVAHNARVTVFTTSPGKIADAKRLGATEAVLSTDANAMKQLVGKFDLLISTVPEAYPMEAFTELLKLDGTLVNVGAMAPLENINGLKLAIGRRSIAGSIIGGIFATALSSTWKRRHEPSLLHPGGERRRRYSLRVILALVLVTRLLPFAVAQSAPASVEIPRGGLPISHKGTRPVTPGSPNFFTGSVKVEQLFAADAPSRVSAGTVTFAPGARSFWHTHPYGQVLLITAGKGRVQMAGAPIQEVSPGDVVRIPAGIKHWHGAAPDSSMTHIAIQDNKDGTAVNWLEPVSEQQYRGGK